MEDDRITRNGSPIITARGLVKSFANDGGENVVLHGIDLDIGPGEFVAIMGPSGSGKSTLLYALSGIDAISGGRVDFEGTSLAGLGEKQLAKLRLTRMGFVFQQIHLLKNLSLLDNVVLPGFLAGDANRAEVVRRARALMERSGIGDLADRTVSQASGGQLQRVGICRALINEPPVPFCDEPTGALNSTSAAEIMDVLDDANSGGTTVIVVTHDPRVAARAHRVLFLVDGEIAGDRRQAPVEGQDLDERHAQLAVWLAERGS